MIHSPNDPSLRKVPLAGPAAEPLRQLEVARWPPPVGPGDRVGVAALSGPVEAERLSAGLDALRELGFEPVVAANVWRREGLFAGTDADRLASFHQLVSDPTLKAIFFTRGGWGMPRLLPALDWELLGRFPRAYVGYSDLTPLLGQMATRLGWVTFHGPLVAADLARGLLPEERDSLLAALAGQPQQIPLAASSPGPSVRGVLAGGCLSLLVALLGTPWALELADRLLVLEDLNEAPYRLDRMLTQLDLAGILPSIRGMILGHMTALGGSQPRSADGTVGALDVFAEHAARHHLPFAWGLPLGHDRPNWTLPLGALASLDPTAGILAVDGADDSAQEPST